MKRQFKSNPLFVLPYTPGAIKLTEAQASVLFTQANIESGERKGYLETVGPWQILKSYTALCTSNTWDDSTYPHTHGPLHVYGMRKLYKVRQSGYELEGKVSIGGRELRGFTSSQLFELPSGKLINCATIHACGAIEQTAVNP